MIDKWETAPSSFKDLYLNLRELFDLYSLDYELLEKVLDDYKELEAKHQKALEAISRCKDEIDDKDKLIEELTHENQVFRLKNLINRRYGLTGQIELLNKEINDLKKENKDLKDTLEKDKEFRKNVGKLVADSIREACEKDVCKLDPCTRIDIHVEETNDMPMIFNRYAIPRIAIMFNNTQTEMERDTAQHECEELNEKIKELEKENKDLKQTLAMCERDANTARNLCDGIAFHAEHARNKTPWFTNF